ncbi:MAG TPA: DUF1127 domain-containing protein [Burkholderiales bacterium]|nr:DUF1127 domain-containing protein [Burkholderiales bacterium]
MIRLLKRLLAAWLERRRAAETKAILHGLSDHALRDLGLRRDQINDYSFFRR